MNAAEVTMAVLSASDADEFIGEAQANRHLHQPWISPPDSSDRFAGYLDHAALEDQAVFVLRHSPCGQLAGYVSVSNIVRRAFCSAYLGYAVSARHANNGFMTVGLAKVIDHAFNGLSLHRLE
ncbi:MAG: GNAT family N-acetyltransferase, partial [Acidimicrobiales bacterium]